jgi:hypothetical protein
MAVRSPLSVVFLMDDGQHATDNSDAAGKTSACRLKKMFISRSAGHE